MCAGIGPSMSGVNHDDFVLQARCNCLHQAESAEHHENQNQGDTERARLADKYDPGFSKH